MEDRILTPGPCEKATDLLIDLMVSGELTEENYRDLCNDNKNCEGILNGLYATWNSMDEYEVPTPSQEMHTKFYKSLAEWQPEEKDGRGKVISLQPIMESGRIFIMRYGVAASLFLGGLATGMIAISLMSDQQQNIPYVQVPAENNNVRTVSTSADRLNQIQNFNQQDINDRIIDALYQALIKDPNTNVRLSALEAMARYAYNPDVRQNLINAILYQTVPLVQISLAEVMINLQEKESSEAWQQLLKSEEMELDVRLQLEDMLQEII
jgi:hypothetical protein